MTLQTARPQATNAPPVHHLLKAIRGASDDDFERWWFQQRAYETFAGLNGWKADSKSRFQPFELATLQNKIFDHHRSFNKALICEPYAHREWYAAGVVLAAEHGGRLGLVCHVPPVPTA